MTLEEGKVREWTMSYCLLEMIKNLLGSSELVTLFAVTSLYTVQEFSSLISEAKTNNIVMNIPNYRLGPKL